MRALILAGGKGTRLRPLTHEIPKELLPVQGKPIISWVVERLARVGVDDIGIAISPEKEEDFLWWRRRWGSRLPVHFFVEPEPLGTFGPLMLAAGFLTSDAEPFFVVNGDVLAAVDLYEMAKAHAKSDAVGTIALVEHPEPQHYGVAVLDGDLITEFREKPRKPPSNLINSGTYLLDPVVLSHYPSDEPAFSMIERELFPTLAEQGVLLGFPWRGQWHDCGTLERYHQAIAEWKA